MPTEEQAVSLKEDLMERFRECKLKLNLKKTKIVYCQDSKRREKYENLSFDYLGFTFISRGNTAEKNKARTKEFMPAVSKKSIKKLKDAILSWNLNRKTFYSIEKLSREINPRIQGWMNYYGKPHQEELWKAMRFLNEKLARWAQHKFQSYYRDFPLEAAYEWLEFQSVENEALFAHWVEGFKPVRKIQRSYREHYAEIFVMEKSKDYEDNMDDYFGIYLEDLSDF